MRVIIVVVVKGDGRMNRTVKIDPELLSNASKILEKGGSSFDTAIEVFLQYIVDNGETPFGANAETNIRRNTRITHVMCEVLWTKFIDCIVETGGK